MTLGWLDIKNARAYGISDDQELSEIRAQKRLMAAIVEMRLAIEAVNASSVLVEIEPSAFDDFVHDECPTPEYWAEKMAEAGRL